MIVAIRTWAKTTSRLLSFVIVSAIRTQAFSICVIGVLSDVSRLNPISFNSSIVVIVARVRTHCDGSIIYMSIVVSNVVSILVFVKELIVVMDIDMIVIEVEIDEIVEI